MHAPTVIAKGAGELALELKVRAARAGIPVMEDKPLARRLFVEVDIDHPVGEELFESVARVYAKVYATARAEPARLGLST
jgi:flagellar biosynthetic protein FlhB